MQFIGTEIPQTKNWTSRTVLSNTADTLAGSVFSDQAGTLKVEQSGNGVNWDLEDDIGVSASTGAAIDVTILHPFVRLVWTGSVDPTVFRVFARMISAGVKP